MRKLVGLALLVIIGVAGVYVCSGSPGTATRPEAGGAAAPAQQAATIPGLAPVDVYGNLTDRGFTKTGPTGTAQQEWRLKAEEPTHSHDVEIFGPSVSSVSSIRATTLNTSGPEADTDRIAAEFLGFVASVPYDGSDPEAARKWVEENVSGNAETTIGGAKFEITANAPRARMLRISAVQ